MLAGDGTRIALVVATGLAVAAVAAAVADIPALSVFLGMITVPAALYAALATRPIEAAVALGDAATGVAVIVYWIYVLITALQGAR